MSAAVFSVRVAEAVDASLLAELGRRMFFDAFAKDNAPEDMEAYLTASFRPEQQAKELADPQTTFLILEDVGVPVGYARLRIGEAPAVITGKRPIEIVRFYAVKEWIGRGVGMALMLVCLSMAKEKGCDTIWLDVWEKNPRAIAFYKKWGFTIVGKQEFILGSDVQQDLLMQRSVAEG